MKQETLIRVSNGIDQDKKKYIQSGWERFTKNSFFWGLSVVSSSLSLLASLFLFFLYFQHGKYGEYALYCFVFGIVNIALMLCLYIYHVYSSSKEFDSYLNRKTNEYSKSN